VLTIIKDELREIQKSTAARAARRSCRRRRDRDRRPLATKASSSRHHNGFIKRTAVSAYRAQRRGGKAFIGMTAREGDEEDDDFVEHLFTATTHDYLMFLHCRWSLLRRARL
jgi:DNA gyrase subunit A